MEVVLVQRSGQAVHQAIWGGGGVQKDRFLQYTLFLSDCGWKIQKVNSVMGQLE